MPRRPLFCQTCDDLLSQVESAAEAVAAFDAVLESGAPARGATLEMRTDLLSRYLELKERAVMHLEIEHRKARTSGAGQLP